MTVFNERFSALAPHYDLALCDVWGVTHNGIAAFPEACDALTRFRAAGGIVILLTNAPRPRDSVQAQLDSYDVPRAAYDGIVSSGDVTRGVISERRGQSVFHLGPDRDLPMYRGLDVNFAPPESADYVVCSGLFNDEVETPDDYRALLALLRKRALFMACANPDVVVERGEQLLYCAGALADLYAGLGGEVLYAGKPHRPIYADALKMAERLRGAPLALQRVLAIGDSLRTDVKGADALGIDCLFVTAGIHASEIGGRDDPDPAALEKIFAAAGVRPKAVTQKLKW